MSEQNHDQLLDTYVADLPKEIVPPKDMWAGIDHAIELRRNEKKWRANKFLQAATVAAIFISTTWFLGSEFNSNTADVNEVNLSMLADDIDKGFKMQKANMLASYKGQAALTSTWEDQLHELEVARSNVWEALKDNPGNTYMVQILVEIQEQQLDLIKSVHSQTNRGA